jgi:hypothetical protein
MRVGPLLLLSAFVTALIVVAGCSKPNPARHDVAIAQGAAVDPKAANAVTMIVQSDVDAIPAAIVQLLTQAAAAGQTTTDQFTITSGGEQFPIDWWLWRRGLIEFRGLDAAGQPLLGVSKAGLVIAAKPPSWFAISGTPDPTSNCDSTGSMTSVTCTIKLSYTVSTNAVGNTATGGLPPLSLTVTDTVSNDGKLWHANAVDYGASGTPSAVLLMAMLGAPADRDAARQKFGAELGAKVEATKSAGVDVAAPAPQE